jgi:hypothetical protein
MFSFIAIDLVDVNIIAIYVFESQASSYIIKLRNSVNLAIVWTKI